MNKAAILLFGQPRIVLPYDYFHASLMRYCARNSEYEFDFYIHHWITDPGNCPMSRWARDGVQPPDAAHDYQLKTYNPVRYLFERQRFFSSVDLHPDTERHWWNDEDLSNMISQIYSLQEVCKLVGKPEYYNWFIAVRTDIEIRDELPLLSTLDPRQVSCCSDIIQIFGYNTLNVYCRLMSQIKEIPVIGRLLNAELLRRYPLELEGIETRELGDVTTILRRASTTEVLLEDYTDHTARVTESGVYCQRGKDEITIKFPPKDVPASNHRILCSSDAEVRFVDQDEWYELRAVRGVLLDMNSRVSKEPIELRIRPIRRQDRQVK